MKTYKLLLQKDLWTIKNIVLEIRQNPKRLISYALFGLWIVYMVFQYKKTNVKNDIESIDPENGPLIVGGAILVISAFLLFYFLNKGTKESTTFFRMGDVNILFPSPVSPRQILLYYILKRSLFNLAFSSFIIIYLIPTIEREAHATFDHNYTYFSYLGFSAFMLSMAPLQLLIFSVGTKYKITEKIKQGLYALTALFVMYVFVVVFLDAEGIYKGFLKGFNYPFLNYIPVFGWLKLSFMTPITGYTVWTLMALIWQFVFFGLIVLACYLTADDYYEDVIGITEKKDLLIKQQSGKEKKDYNVVLFNENKEVHVEFKGSGAKAFILKSLIELKRMDMHPFYSLQSITFAIIGLGGGYMCNANNWGINGILVINAMVAYFLLLIFSSTSSQNEFSKPYIYLIPASNFQKIIYGYSIQTIRMGISIIVMNFFLVLLTWQAWYWLVLLSVFMITFYIINILISLLIRMLLPNMIDQKVFFPVIFLLQVFIIVIPPLIAGIIAGTIFKSVIAIVLGITLANLFISLILLILSEQMMGRVELR